MFNCIKSFSYKMNISANQVSNALRMKALAIQNLIHQKLQAIFLRTNSQFIFQKITHLADLTTNLPILTELLKTEQTARF